MTRIGQLTACAVVALAAAMLAGAALAQQAPAQGGGQPPAGGPPGDAPAADAPPAPPPPPAHLEACGAARCLTVGAGADLQAKLASGDATLDDLASGLTFTYEGLEPVRVYFVAARYDDDRLVRYDVSNAITIQPGAVSFPDIAEVLTNALGPRTESGVAVSNIPAEVSAAAPDLPSAAFVGSMPANTLMQLVRPDLTEPLSVEQRAVIDEVGVLAVITRDAALRENMESKSIGQVLRLTYSE